MDAWDQATSELKGEKVGPDEWDQAAAELKPGIIEKASDLAARFGKQFWNKGVVDTLQYLRQHSEVGKMFQDAEELSLIQDAKKSGKPIDYNAVKQQATANMQASAERNIPHAEVAPAAGTAEQVVDVGAGMIAFMSQLAALKKAIPGLSKPLLWEVQNQINGGRPGAGAVNQVVFGGVGKIAPGKTLAGKIRSTAAQSAALAGITAAQGGSPVEIVTMAAVPVGFQGWAGIKAALAPKIGPYAGEGPGVVRQGRTISPEVPQLAGAEGTIPAVEPGQVPILDSRTQLHGKYAAELQAKHEAYIQLQAYIRLLDAIGSGDEDRIASARDIYAQAGPPTYTQVFEASDAGDPEAQARLNEGYFQHDDVDTISPLTVQERSRAKRIGFSKDLTGREGRMTPGQVRYALRGDQGVATGPTQALEETPEKAPVKPEPIQDIVFSSPDFDRDKTETKKRAEQIKVKTDDQGKLMINSRASPRYAYGDLDAVSGRPLGTWIMDASDRIAQTHRDTVMKLMGTFDPDDMRYPTEESPQKIGDALYSGNTDKLSPEEKVIYNACDHMLQTEGSRVAARNKWKNLKEGIERPADMSIEDAKIALTEGHAAERAGKLDEWLAEQSWGARKNYFMSDNDEVRDDKILDKILYGEKQTPGLIPGASRTRQRKGQALRTKNPILDTVNHIARMARLDTARDELPPIIEAVHQIGFGREAKQMIRDHMRTMVGSREMAVGELKRATMLQRLFWKLKMADPRWRIGRFSLLQYLQLFHMKAQTSFKAEIYGIRHAFDKITPAMERTMDYHYGIKSQQALRDADQLRQLEWSFRDRHPEIEKMMNPLIKTMTWINRLSADSYGKSRNVVYKVFYTSADHYLGQLRDGKINWNQFESKVQLKSLHPGNQLQDIYYRIEHGHWEKAADMIAYAKTMNVHDPYEARYKPLGQQTTAQGLITGPRTWVRTTWEMFYRNGFKLVQDGYNNKNWSLAYRGGVNIIAGITALYLSDQIYEVTTGRKRIPGVDLILGRNPGTDLLYGTMSEIQKDLRESSRLQETPEQTANRLVGTISRLGESSIPFVDGIAQYYESHHDAEGISLWNLALAKINKKQEIANKKKWNRAERTSAEAMFHVITGGGFEEGEKKQKRRALRQEVKSR